MTKQIKDGKNYINEAIQLMHDYAKKFFNQYENNEISYSELHENVNSGKLIELLENNNFHANFENFSAEIFRRFLKYENTEAWQRVIKEDSYTYLKLDSETTELTEMNATQLHDLKNYIIAQINNSEISITMLNDDLENNDMVSYHRDIMQVQNNCINYGYATIEQLKELDILNFEKFYSFVIITVELNNNKKVA